MMPPVWSPGVALAGIVRVNGSIALADGARVTEFLRNVTHDPTSVGLSLAGQQAERSGRGLERVGGVDLERHRHLAVVRHGDVIVHDRAGLEIRVRERAASVRAVRRRRLHGPRDGSGARRCGCRFCRRCRRRCRRRATGSATAGPAASRIAAPADKPAASSAMRRHRRVKRRGVITNTSIHERYGRPRRGGQQTDEVPYTRLWGRGARRSPRVSSPDFTAR